MHPATAPPSVPGVGAGGPAWPGLPGAPARSAGLAQRLRSLPRAAWAGGALVIVIGIVLLSGGSRTHRVEGTFALIDVGYLSQSNGAACRGDGGYSDIRSGLQVRATDDTGRLIASSSLNGGSVDGISCVFTFELADVPSSSYYSFEVGRRGEMTYSHDEMVGNAWQVAFSLGGS